MNPKQRIAMILAERKRTMGPIPKSPTAPMNAISGSPSLVPPNQLAPSANPMTLATTSLVKPSFPGMGRFGKIKKTLNG